MHLYNAEVTTDAWTHLTVDVKLTLCGQIAVAINTKSRVFCEPCVYKEVELGLTPVVPRRTATG